MKKSLFALSLLFSSTVCFTQNLDRHRWKDRVILIIADSPLDAEVLKQDSILKRAKAGIKERDLVIYHYYSVETSDLQALNPVYSIEIEKGFNFLLIGKDGGVKLKSSDPVDTEQLFDLIDSMPMRRNEMQRKSSG